MRDLAGSAYEVHVGGLGGGCARRAGYRGLAKLDAALRAHDGALDNRKQAA
jgi:hypothetical protein